MAAALVTKLRKLLKGLDSLVECVSCAAATPTIRPIGSHTISITYNPPTALDLLCPRQESTVVLSLKGTCNNVEAASM